MVKRLLTVLSCLTVVVWTHPEGVPLEYWNICQTMIPSHNGTAPKTDVAPFSISLSANCYDTTQPIDVTVKSTQATIRFMGFFVEARKPGVDSFSYGTFDNNGDRDIKTLNCFNKEASAVCQYNPAMRARSVRHAGHDHHEHAKWSNKTFKWTPPNDITSELEFVKPMQLLEWGCGACSGTCSTTRAGESWMSYSLLSSRPERPTKTKTAQSKATVLKEYKEFWIGIKSETFRSCFESKASSSKSSTLIHPSALLAAVLATAASALWIRLLIISIAD